MKWEPYPGGDCSVADCDEPWEYRAIIDIGEWLDEHTRVAEDARLHEIRLCKKHGEQVQA